MQHVHRNKSLRRTAEKFIEKKTHITVKKNTKNGNPYKIIDRYMQVGNGARTQCHSLKGTHIYSSLSR